MIPVLEHNVDGHRPEVFEEPVRWPAGDHRLAPRQHGEPRHGMEAEGEEIERHQNTGQGILSMPKVVFQIISIGFQHVEGLVFDLPPCPATGGEVRHGGGGDLQIGDETVEIRSLAFGVQDFNENQLTMIASSVARNGTPECQR